MPPVSQSVNRTNDLLRERALNEGSGESAEHNSDGEYAPLLAELADSTDRTFFFNPNTKLTTLPHQGYAQVQNLKALSGIDSDDQSETAIRVDKFLAHASGFDQQVNFTLDSINNFLHFILTKMFCCALSWRWLQKNLRLISNEILARSCWKSNKAESGAFCH